MKIRTLIRSYLHDRTIGKLGNLKTLERPWLNNQSSISCIPEGVYRVDRDHSGRFQYYRVQDTLPRTDIEFHGGVYPRHSEGCILVGLSHDKEYNLIGSDQALIQLVKDQEEESFILEIRQYNPLIDGVF